MHQHKNDPFIVKMSGGKIRDRGLDWHQNTTDRDGYVHLETYSPLNFGPIMAANKIRIALGLLSIIFIVLGLRIFYLQFVQGDYYRYLAEGNRIRLVRVEPARGIIYDTNGEQLVRNIPSFSLHIIPADMVADQDNAKIISEIATITGYTEDDLWQTINEYGAYSYVPIPLVDNLTNEQAILLKIKTADWTGFEVHEHSVREYIADLSLSHVLGYLGKITAEEYENLKTENYQLINSLGKSGLEKYYEDDLRGQAGIKNVEVDAFGKELKILAEEKASAGNDLYLYIDQQLQRQINEVMSESLEKKKLTKAVAVFIDPQSGGVLASLSYPNFDNNIFNHSLSQKDFKNLFNNPDQPMFNRAISGQYPSGSTIKPLIAAAALQEGVITRWTTFNSVGGIYYDIWYFPDWKAGGHGTTDVVKALAESVNTFFYRIGIDEYDGQYGLGLDRMVNYMRDFGLGVKTGIDLPGEVTGLVPTREWKWDTQDEVWYPGDTMHLAIGQGSLLVTPMQMANYIAAIANGGTLWAPQIYKELKDSSTEIVSSSVPTIIRDDLIDQENIDIVREGMRAAVTRGSARLLNTSQYQAAGKTGTAQVGGDKQPHSWFVGFAPFDDPQIAWAVVVENGGDSTDAAVPIVKEVLDWYFRE